MEKWMIVYVLPLEVWMDIFCFPWISREEFGQLVARIGNFKFAEHAQFYLHEWGKRTLDGVYFRKDGLRRKYNGESYMDIPQTPLPPNIKSFQCIEIIHFDSQTLDFLDKLRPLLTDVEIAIFNDFSDNFSNNLRTILTTLAPMLRDGIRSVCCGDESGLPVMKELFFCEKERLAKLKMLDIYIDFETVEEHEMVTFIMNWLALPDNGGPRLFQINIDENDFPNQITVAIRKQFHIATTPRTFAVNLNSFIWRERRLAEFHLQNGIGEELDGKWTEIGREDIFQITRHRASWNTKEAREWIEEMTKEKHHPCIWIENLTIGSLDADQWDVPQADEEKPSTSNEA